MNIEDLNARILMLHPDESLVVTLVRRADGSEDRAINIYRCFDTKPTYQMLVEIDPHTPSGAIMTALDKVLPRTKERDAKGLDVL
jgi:hypothetical protein